MPTYEYECEKCKKHFDVFQSMKDEPIKTCPDCGGKVARLIGGGSGIIFKGKGFYETDYRKKKRTDNAPKCPGTKSDNCGSCPMKDK